MKTIKATRAAASNLDLAAVQAKRHVMAWMEENPDKVIPLWAQLETGLLNAPPKVPAALQDTWHETYTYWRQIPKYWLAQVITHIHEDAPSAEVLDNMNLEDPEAFRKVVNYMFGVSCNQKVPKPLLKKAVMAKWLTQRGQDLGSRKLEWARKGVYQLTKDTEGHIDKVVHPKLGTADISKAINVDQGWGIKDNHCDLTACIETGFATLYLKNFFQEEGHKYYWQQWGAGWVADSAQACSKEYHKSVEAISSRKKKQDEDRKEKAKRARAMMPGKAAAVALELER